MKQESKIYSIIIAIFPIISIYSTGISSLSLGDALLLLYVIYIVLKRNGKSRIVLWRPMIPLLVFAVYITITLIFQILLGTEIGILSTLRFLLYLLALILLTDSFNFRKGIRVLGFITVLVSAYVILQYLFFRIIGSTLPWRIPFLDVVDENFINKEFTPYYLQFYRPTGFFYEPTHYAQYCLIYFCYLLFCNDVRIRKKWLHIIIISAGIICSGSAAGLFIIAILFALYYWKYISKGRVTKQTIALSLLLIAGIYIVVNSASLSRIFTKLISSSGSGLSSSVGYRFNSVVNVFSKDRGIFEVLFGTGRASTGDTYYTAVFYVLYCHGMVGFIIFLATFIVPYIWLKTDFQRSAILTIFIMSIGSEMMINFGMLTYLTYIYRYSQTDNSPLAIENVEEML